MSAATSVCTVYDSSKVKGYGLKYNSVMAMQIIGGCGLDSIWGDHMDQF